MHPKTYSGRLKQSRVDLFSLFMITDKVSTMGGIYKKGGERQRGKAEDGEASHARWSGREGGT
jgi:hypothetical protein